MSSSGWIKLHRKITDWEWYTDHKVFVLFIHLLLTANQKDSKYKGHVIPKGSRVSGLLKLSEETGLSVQELRTASDKLKSTGNITIKSTNKFSIITVCNYEKYQQTENREQQANQQAEQQTSNKRATTSKEVKNIRSKEKESTKEKKNGFDLAKLPGCIHEDVALAFIEHRKALKAPLTQYALELTCKDAVRCQDLHGINPNDAIRRVIAQGWKGCNPKYFEPKNERRNGTATKTSRQQYMEDVGNLLENIDEATNNGCPTRIGQAAQPLPGIRPQHDINRKIGV